MQKDRAPESEHRLGTTTLEVVDRKGAPLKNTDLVIRQESLRLLIGCNIFELDPDKYSEDQVRYQSCFADLFNYATLPFYWGQYEPSRDHPDTERLIGVAKWCHDRDITTKGHTLLWHNISPKWLSGLDLSEQYRLQMERIGREVTSFSGLVDIWDVANELVATPDDTRKNHMTPIVKEYGVVPVLEEAFALARQSGPRATLILNDFDWWSGKFEELIEKCLGAGIPIDAIGMQSHMHRGYHGNETIWEICERFSRFGKPLHWTEISIGSGRIPEKFNYRKHEDDWNSTPEGEERQTREVLNLYSTLYAHPAVEAITWWDLRDGCWLGAPSGLIRKDMSPKPAYEELSKLVTGEWSYGEQTQHTDGVGCLELTGPLGTYSVSIHDRIFSLELQRDSKKTRRLIV